MTASAGTLTVARMFFQTDPYNIFKVLQEKRVVVVPEENRQTLINSIRRVNIPPIDITQSRDFFREQIRLNHPSWPDEEDMEDLQQAILMSLSNN